MELRWRSGGTQVELRWRSGGGQVELRWRSGGTQVELRWRAVSHLCSIRHTGVTDQNHSLCTQKEQDEHWATGNRSQYPC